MVLFECDTSKYDIDFVHTVHKAIQELLPNEIIITIPNEQSMREMTRNDLIQVIERAQEILKEVE